MITEITKIISLILAISLASERLVAFLKTLIPWLASNQTPGPPVDPKTEKIRKLVVMGIAFLAAWLTAGFLSDPGTGYIFGKITLIPDKFHLPCVIVGLLASGGSAFWANLLGYFKGLKDISTQKVIEQKLTNYENLQAFVSGKDDFTRAKWFKKSARDRENEKVITFLVKFYDGKGGIIFFDAAGSMGAGKTINSDNGGSQSFTVTQAPGLQRINVTGNAPNGGKITVEVQDADGNVLTSADNNVFDQQIIDSYIQPYTVK